MSVVLEKQPVEAPQAEAVRKKEKKRKRGGFAIFLTIVAWGLILAGWIIAARMDDLQFLASWMVMTWSPYWLALAAPAALACLTARRWGFLLLHLVGSAAFLIFGGHYQLPQLFAPAGEGEPVKVMSYNIKSGLAQGMKAVGETILSEDPDVVLLQECWRGPISESLEKELPGYRVLGDGSRLIATKLPVISWESRFLLKDSRYGLMEAILETPSGPVAFMSVHKPSYNLRTVLPKGATTVARYPGMVAFWQTKLLKELKEEVEEAQQLYPVVLGGDFNCPPVGRRYDVLDGLLDDSFAQAGQGWNLTFPSALPGISIDRIWLDNRLAARESRVVASRASDHLPLVTVFGSRQKPLD
jgi:endonuclease/exonuclease/phosphatase (EEP) superfamily protein YafD